MTLPSERDSLPPNAHSQNLTASWPASLCSPVPGSKSPPPLPYLILYPIHCSTQHSQSPTLTYLFFFSNTYHLPTHCLIYSFTMFSVCHPSYSLFFLPLSHGYKAHKGRDLCLFRFLKYLKQPEQCPAHRWLSTNTCWIEWLKWSLRG